MTQVTHHSTKRSGPHNPDRVAVLKGMAVSQDMVRAAQESYAANPEYGLTDSDMAKAIKAALKAAIRSAA